MKKKVIRLNENGIENLVRKILRESDFDWADDVPTGLSPEVDIQFSKFDSSGESISCAVTEVEGDWLTYFCTTFDFTSKMSQDTWERKVLSGEIEIR